MPLADLIAANPEAMIIGCLAVSILIAYLLTRTIGAIIVRINPVPVVREHLRHTVIIDTAIALPPVAGIIFFGSLLAAGMGDNANLARVAFGLTFWQWGLGIVAVGAIAVVAGNMYWGLTDPVVSNEERIAAIREIENDDGGRAR